VTFEDFRKWALDSSRGAALRWEEPDDDEIMVLLAADDYDAHHVIPVPPFYLRLERGHVPWLREDLPHIVANRSLRRVAFRTSAWTTRNPKYEDNPVDDPQRGELLMLHIAEKGRYEVWIATIKRSKADLPRVGEWELHATDKDGLSGALPTRIRQALDKRGKAKGPTMPAADMVLGPWDVPPEFMPRGTICGPLDHARKMAVSSYIVVYRPVLPGPVIAGQTLVFPNGDEISDYVKGVMQALVSAHNKEFAGPQLGLDSHYFEGTLDGGRLQRYTAVWRYERVFSECSVSGPPGTFNADDLLHYAAIQDRRAQANLPAAGV